MKRSRTIVATPPGSTIKEQLIDRGMSQKEFCKRMDMTEKHISRLINGEVQLTHDMARRLELVLGIPASFWNKLEAIYREKLLKVQVENEMDEDLEIIKKLPYSEMAKNGWVPLTKLAKERVSNLRKFFEIVKLSLINENLIPGIACRRQAITEKSDYALVAWAQKAKVESRTIPTAPIDLKMLGMLIPEIRKMTRTSPEVFCDELKTLLSKCGIALVFLPHMTGSFLHGATFYDKDKIVIGLTVRGKDADKFWFSLFHEIGHVLLGHINKLTGTTDEEENAADAFASEALIPSDLLKSFVDSHNTSSNAMINFAQEIGVDVGIVVGRLQKEGIIKYSWHNDLKKHYTIA